MKPRIYSAPAVKVLTQTTMKNVSINHGTKEFFNLNKCPSQLLPLNLNTYVVTGYGSTAIVHILIISVWGPSLDVRIGRLNTVPALEGLTLQGPTDLDSMVLQLFIHVLF